MQHMVLFYLFAVNKCPQVDHFGLFVKTRTTSTQMVARKTQRLV